MSELLRQGRTAIGNFFRVCADLIREAARVARAHWMAHAFGWLIVGALTIAAFRYDAAVNDWVLRLRPRSEGLNQLAHYYRWWGRGHDTAALFSLVLIWAAAGGCDRRARAFLVGGLAAIFVGMALGWRFGRNAGYALVIPGIGLLAAAARRGDRSRARCALAALLAALLSGLIANTVRFSTGRPRPRASDITRLQGPTLEADHQSFPSGHTATSTGAAACLLVCSPPVGAVALINAVGIGWSSLHVRAHHLSDIVAGAGVGLLVGFALGGAARRKCGRPATPGPGAGSGKLEPGHSA